jgi:glycosyltransferase involved in cell wall biosynthesis
MKLCVVVPFLNEEEHIGRMLVALEGQKRLPDRLVLVDDGSTDGSPEIAAAFAERHPYATLLRRPVRPAERDRMAQAAELEAFHWALDQVDEPWDIVAKLDADLEATPDLFAEIERRFQADPGLGMAGAYLTVVGHDGVKRHRCPPDHVEGATGFYRRECFEQISPLPSMLGWDTIDEVRARLHGWRTRSFEIPSGDPLLMRRTGSHDGILRGFRRTGLAAYAYGAHPLHVLAAALVRMTRERPLVLGGANYLIGWAGAVVARRPRAERAVRRRVRQENLARLRATIERKAHS